MSGCARGGPRLPDAQVGGANRDLGRSLGRGGAEPLDGQVGMAKLAAEGEKGWSPRGTEG